MAHKKFTFCYHRQTAINQPHTLHSRVCVCFYMRDRPLLLIRSHWNEKWYNSVNASGSAILSSAHSRTWSTGIQNPTPNPPVYPFPYTIACTYNRARPQMHSSMLFFIWPSAAAHNEFVRIKVCERVQQYIKNGITRRCWRLSFGYECRRLHARTQRVQWCWEFWVNNLNRYLVGVSKNRNKV